MSKFFLLVAFIAILNSVVLLWAFVFLLFTVRGFVIGSVFSRGGTSRSRNRDRSYVRNRGRW